MAEKAESTSASSSTTKQDKQKDDRKVGRDFAVEPDSHIAEGEDAQQAGYWGSRPNVFDDEEFALTTGPGSPGAADLENPEDYVSEEKPR